jgi:Fe-S-cluster containining protein
MKEQRLENDICKVCEDPCCMRERIVISPPEYEVISKYIDEKLEKRGEFYRLTPDEGGFCLALGEAGCKIPYEFRPLICTTFPYMLHEQSERACPHFDKFVVTPQIKRLINEEIMRKRRMYGDKHKRDMISRGVDWEKVVSEEMKNRK